MKLLPLLVRGRQAQRDEHAAGEGAKLGTLRGGSAGILTPEGQVYGTCPRLSHLRKLGKQVEVEPYADILFAAGYSNEDIVAEELRAAGIPFKQEEEIPVVWETSNGTKVTGRPDIVILDEAGNPAMGLELKLISSIWTAKSVMGQGEPKSDHLIQAAHYSWKLDIPWKLVYANRAYWHINYNKFLTTTFKDNEYCEHKEDRPFRILPAYCVFELEWQGDRLHYRKEGTEEYTSTEITKDSIESYFEAVAGIIDKVPPRPTNKHVNGGKSYKACDYCALSDVCDTHESADLQRWTDEATIEINKLAEERKL